MSRTRLALASIAIVVLAATAWIVGSRLRGPGTESAVPPAGAGPAAAGGAAERRIKATLYFISEDGMSLVGVQQDVTFGESVVEQARHIVEAQLGEAPEPLSSAIPPETKLRGIFITDRGEAYVDLNAASRANHTGGSLDELFTVYAIVDALTVNLPAITRVQILVEGKEVDTLAGHVDLRHPLQQNLQWVRTEQP